MQTQWLSTWRTSQPQRRKPADDKKLSRTNRLRAVAERPSIVEPEVERRAEGSANTAQCPFSAGGFSTTPKDHLPFKPGPYKISMGLTPLQADDWIEIDEHYVQELEERNKLLHANRDRVVGCIPEAAPANEEVLEMLAEFLPRRFPDRFSCSGSLIHNHATNQTLDLAEPGRNSLEIASLLVQEDLCIMQHINGKLVFTSAAVYFPMRWFFMEKVGREMDGIHSPVPFYQEDLKRPVDNFMAKGLKAGKPFQRSNWMVSDNPDLNQLIVEDDILEAKAGTLWAEASASGQESITLENAPERLFLRCERQTLTRLPKTGGVLFTIRTYSRTLREVLARPDGRALAGRLAAASAALPDVTVNYKTMASYRRTAVEYLEMYAAGRLPDLGAAS